MLIIEVDTLRIQDLALLSRPATSNPHLSEVITDSDRSLERASSSSISAAAVANLSLQPVAGV